jgi:helicase
MILVPENVDFLTSAASSAAKARGAQPETPTKNTLDVAVALKCIGSYQLQTSLDELRQLDEEENAAPLIAAARTLQSSADLLTGAPESLWTLCELMLSASLAHAMYGNFPSAKAALRRVSPEYLVAAPLRCIAAVVCDPTGPLATQNDDPLPGIVGFRWNWFYALRNPTSEDRAQKFQDALGILQSAAATSNTSDRALGLSIEVAMTQAHRLATATLFDLTPEIPAWFVQNTIDSGITTLLPPQHDLLTRRRIAQQSGNSLLTLPTSTGKTLIAEACMTTASHSGGLSVYVAPYVAIGEQVRISLSAKVKDKLPLISMFGGFKFESATGTGGRALIVMTPERLDAWLRIGEHLKDLRLVVFDEIHIVENGSRGARVEGLISRLRLLQKGLPQLRILGLSAVLVEPQQLCQWMGVTPENLHRISWRPTARRIATCDEHGSMHWVHGFDSLRPENTPPTTAISGSVQIRLPERVKPAINPGTYETQASNNVGAIVLDLLDRLGEPALVVCPKKVDTRLIAASLANQLPIAPQKEVAKIADDIVSKYSWLTSLANCIRHGIAYHNASLPYDVRRELEQATRSGLLRVVCSTTTLAEGADLPFRWTLVSHWLGSDNNILKSMTFRNIAGRNGRAGAFTEGDTVIFANRGGPPEAYYQANLKSKMNTVMFSSTPIESTAGLIYQNLKEQERSSIRATFSSQLVASIKENHGADDIVGLLSSATYASQSHSQSHIKSILDASMADLLDAKRVGGPLAVMNSPVQLTPVGEAVNQTGFSPDSARKMLHYLSSIAIPPPPSELLVQLLSLFGSLDEQQNYLWRKVLNESGQKHPLKPTDMKSVLVKLLQKHDIRDIFEQLPARVKSKAKPGNVDKQFDNFVSLIDSLIFNYLPWLLRGLSSLAPFGSNASQGIQWTHYASQVENSSSQLLEVESIDD